MTDEGTSLGIGNIPSGFFADRSIDFNSALRKSIPESRYSLYEALFLSPAGGEITNLEDYNRPDLYVFQSLLRVLREYNSVDSGRDGYLAQTIKKFGVASQGGDVGDIKTNLLLNLTGHIEEIRKNDLLKWFELELLSAQFPNGINYIGGLSVSPGAPENTLTPNALRKCFKFVCEFAREHDFYVNFTLFWSAWLHKDRQTRKGSISHKRFLRSWIDKNPHHSNLFQEKREGGLLLHHRNDLVPFGEVVPVHPEVCSRFYKPEPKEYLDEFWNIYKRYIRGLLASLSFVNCSSKLTRLEKLYVKPLQFRLNHPSLFSEGEFETFMDELRENAQNTTNTVLGIELSKNKDEQFGEESINLLRELKNFEAKRTALQKSTSPFKKIFPKLFDERRETESAGQDQLISHHISVGRPLTPLVVAGDAGKGKTIALSRFAQDYLMRIEDEFQGKTLKELQTLHLPLFFRAKHMSAQFNILSNPKHPVRELWGALTTSLPEIMHHISREDFFLLYNRWQEFQDQHNSSMVFFIDGLDECSTPQAAENILHWLSRQKTNFSSLFNESYSSFDRNTPVIVLATRPSHLDVVKETLPSFAIADMSQEGYYSEKELSLLMPLQLCDAWGITREPGRELHKMFKQYKTTLIHPLFVGWFCFLILENKFEEIETKSDNVHIRQNNLVSRIVEIGIQESLQRRESSHKDSGITSQGSEFVNLLKTFVAVAFHNTIHHPDEIFTRMVKLGYCDDLSDSLKHSIMHDCGILYLTGESIEWTHSTVPELIYADFFHDAQRSFRLGSLRVTEPILLRLAQLDYEQGRAASFEIALMRLYHRHDRHNFEEMCWDIWIEQGDDPNSYAPLLRMAETGTPTVIQERSPEARELARMYLDFMDTPYRFGLYPDHFEKESRAALIEHVVGYSDDPFGLDLVLSDDNVVDHHSISVEKVNSSTSVAGCFRFYRELLKHEPYEHIPLDHSALRIHRRAGDFSGIFDVYHITRPLYLDDDFGGVATWLKFEKSNHHPWVDRRALLIDYITKEYLTTAYVQLVGDKENAIRCINLMYDELKDYEYTEYFEDMDETHHLLTWLLLKQHFTGEVIELFDEENWMTRGFFLLLFVRECLRHLDGHRNVISEILEYEIHGDRILVPFELVKQYAPNLKR